MKIVNLPPPNYELLKMKFNPPPDALFCYGNTIYNPGNRTITPDLELHEAVHSKQQGGSPDIWYTKYITDDEFRFSQELEAYGTQYAFAKGQIEKAQEQAEEQGKTLKIPTSKLKQWALESMASALSGASYGGFVSLPEAESKIRNYAKHNALPYTEYLTEFESTKDNENLPSM